MQTRRVRLNRKTPVDDGHGAFPFRRSEMLEEKLNEDPGTRAELPDAMRSVLSPQHCDEFDRLGILCLPGAIPKTDADQMCDSVWHVLERRRQIHRDAPDTWQGHCIRGTRDLPKSLNFEQVGSATIRAALDDLIGPGNWDEPD